MASPLPALQAAEAAAACAWADFLSNRVHLAAVRASPFVDGLRRLLASAAQSSAAAADGTELLVTLADLAYIAGACDGDNPQTLELAVAAYDQFIALAPAPASTNAMRMRAEALLRLRRYSDAFAAFSALHARRLAQGVSNDDEVAPFRLVHDAEALEAAATAAAAGGEAAPGALERAARWRELVSRIAGNIAGDSSTDAPDGEVDGGDDTGRTSAADATDGAATALATPASASLAATAPAASATPASPATPAALADPSGAWRIRVRVGSLNPSDRHLLGPEFGQPIPRPLTLPTHWREGMPVLRPRTNWAIYEATYLSSRCAVIDGLLSDEALRELQQYAQHGAHFAASRHGYLGCFPADGATHPILLSLSTELAAAMRAVFTPHALALWWLFKYCECSGDGIGLHADPAAVNVNLWLTPDEARISGGGLLIYSHVPPLEQPVAAANHEFDSPAAEEALRRRLRAGGVSQMGGTGAADGLGQAGGTGAAGGMTEVAYACNRAVVFISDQYHESQPFQFHPGYQNRRCNLTLLFGDRWSVRPPISSGGVGATSAGGGGMGLDGTGGQADRGESTGAGGWDVFD
jgi:hypothetical protein